MCTLLETEPMSNLIFFPGMAENLIAQFEKRRPKVLRLKKFGALADLFPGACAAAADPDALVDCARERARCATCRSLHEADGVPLDCERYDDGVADDSCS